MLGCSQWLIYFLVHTVLISDCVLFIASPFETCLYYKFFSSLWSRTFFKFPCRGFCNFSRSIFWNNAEEITTWVLARSSPCKLLFFIQLSFETLFSYLSAFPALDLYQLSKKVFLVAIHWCSDVWNVFAHMQYCNLFPESYLEVKY